MTCPACQHDNRATARFCENCGAPLGRRCEHCGGPLAAGANFCPDCGRPAAAAGAARPFGGPEAYTPRHLAERILTSRTALEGERKQVTVLFADVKGSMELIADRDPEAARQILDPVLQLMMDAVHRFEGTVNQVLGDGVMALFGAPLALEDHAVRACFAALRIRDAVRGHTAQTRRAHGVEVQVRVGLNSGEVVVRSIGSDLRMDYTAVGGTTHLAARMEQLAPPGAIRLTADTFHLAEGFVQVNDLGPVPVKGLDAPVAVYELMAAGPARTRLQAAATRGLSHFVGREVEMEQLRGALEQAQRGRGEVVAVVGEPGVGKSRLLHELTHSARGRGCLILETRSLSYGRATAYLPVIDLLKAYLRIDEGDDTRAIRAKVTGQLLTLDEALGDAIPPILWLLDALPSADGFRSLAPPQRRQRTLDAVKRVLLRESGVRPLVLVFEDLQWTDGETQAVLDGLVDGLPTAALLLLASFRPEYRHEWAGRTYYRQLRIDPLTPATADEMLRALAGDGADLAPLKALLVGRTEGNPLFLEESVRALVETGALAGERGAYRLTRPVDHLHIPASIQAILAARIDRLSPEDKRLLQAGAVIGKDVPLPLLLAVADAPESEVRGALGRLQAAEFLHETRLFPEIEHTFKHALTHEVAYGSLLQDRRRELHARIARAIEGLTPAGRAEQLERLAYHTFHGELWSEAVPALREAGLRALARSAHREAVIHLERALAALSHLPEGSQARALAIDLRLDMAPALSGAARYGDLRQRMLEAEPLAEASGDRIRQGRVLLRLSQAVRMFGDYARATDVGHRAVAVAETTGDVALRSETLHRLGQIYLGVGDSARALDVLRRSVAVLGDLDGTAEPSGFIRGVGAHAWLGYALGYRGEFAEAIASGQRALRLAESGNSPGNLLAALGTLGLTLVEQGDVSAAIPVLERALATCERWTILDWSITVESTLGVALALAGRFEDALALQRRAEAEEPHAPQGFPAGRILRFGETCWLAGRFDDARAQAEQGLALARAGGERGAQVRALRLLGDVSAGRDGLEAERSFREALALAEELGMHPQVARCHLGLGARYAQASRPREAEEHLTLARTMLADMGMSGWAAPARPVL